MKYENSLPLHVSAAYSGRIACAYQTPGQDSAFSTGSDGSIQFSCSLAIYECESTGGSQWVLEDKFDIQDIVSNPGECSMADLDLAYLSKVAQGRSTTRLTSTLSSEDLSQAYHTSSVFSVDAIHSVSSQLLVPSPSTLHSLRNQRFDKRGVSVKQKHPVQIDWVSQEDGSHLLTVAIGTKILAYTSVADDIAMVSCQGKMKDKESRPRPVLQKSLSLHALSDTNLPRWMRLEKLSLTTADGLAPLPMQMSWVRDGILVVGMDNEMHVYSQWHVPASTDQKNIQQQQQEAVNAKDEGRELTKADLKLYLQESSHSAKSATSMSHVASFSILSALDNKMKKGLGEVMSAPVDDADSAAISGIFEASHIASPVLPQYHPRQLMELLNCGKIRRVKAILAHLVRCLSQLGQRSTDSAYRSSLSDAEDNRNRNWSRSRTLSMSGNQGGSTSRDGRGSVTLLPEELTLDYIEVTAIPPLPLWLLLEADKDTQNQQTKKTDNKEDTYVELFGTPTISVDEDLTLDDEEDIGSRRKSLSHEVKSIAFFGPRQAQILAALLTHTHLPGLSSLDQMHLLALADTVASCNVDFADRFDINKAKEALAKETFSRTSTDEPSM
ncbi:dmX-like protein 1, partial [Cherax quadricarinatus]|uniref:dmX-like protein 1 n=1 Tax=Cherax quadricarinatus TaxID=27406 RepID=UPI00387E4915